MDICFFREKSNDITTKANFVTDRMRRTEEDSIVTQ